MLEHYFKHLNLNFSGWDFSYLTSTLRMHQAPLPWNYYVLASQFIREAQTVLDLGTGGGEFLSTLPIENCTVYATERYKPNIDIAKQRLEPLHVTVFGLDEKEPIPLKESSVDLILSRHEAFEAHELFKLLKKDGVFVTQQVGGHNNKEFYELLETPPSKYRDYNNKDVAKQLVEAGLTVLKAEAIQTYTRFYDIAAVIYYLTALSFQFSNYGSEQFINGIKAIEGLINKQGFFDVNCDRFIIVAKK